MVEVGEATSLCVVNKHSFCLHVLSSFMLCTLGSLFFSPLADYQLKYFSSMCVYTLYFAFLL